jgi:hypothetical protein
VVAPKHVLENVSASDMVSLAQVYVVVSARSNFFKTFDYLCFQVLTYILLVHQHLKKPKILFEFFCDDSIFAFH